MARRDLLALLSCLAAAALCSCIERPVSIRNQRDRFDRSALSDVVSNQAPTPMRRVGAIFGDDVELYGVDWSPARPKPGDQVQVTYYFRVIDETEENYKVFVHVDDHAGHAERINADHWAAQERYPLKMWRRGEFVRDTWSFKIPKWFDGEALDLWTGFYPPGKDDRWPLSNKGEVTNDGQNRVLAASLPTR